MHGTVSRLITSPRHRRAGFRLTCAHILHMGTMGIVPVTYVSSVRESKSSALRSVNYNEAMWILQLLWRESAQSCKLVLRETHRWRCCCWDRAVCKQFSAHEINDEVISSRRHYPTLWLELIPIHKLSENGDNSLFAGNEKLGSLPMMITTLFHVPVSSATDACLL